LPELRSRVVDQAGVQVHVMPAIGVQRLGAMIRTCGWSSAG